VPNTAQIAIKLKLLLNNTITNKMLTYTSETSILTKKDRKQLNTFESKVYRRFLGPVYDDEKENWRILTDKEIHAIVKKPTIAETVRLHRLCWFRDGQRMEGNKIPKRVLYMNLESTRPRGRPRNKCQNELTEDGKIVGGKGWQEKVCNREEWKKLLGKSKESSHSAHGNGMNEWYFSLIKCTIYHSSGMINVVF
jgi:hypothetical protein